MRHTALCKIIYRKIFCDDILFIEMFPETEKLLPYVIYCFYFLDTCMELYISLTNWSCWECVIDLSVLVILFFKNTILIIISRFLWCCIWVIVNHVKIAIINLIFINVRYNVPIKKQTVVDYKYHGFEKQNI